MTETQNTSVPKQPKDTTVPNLQQTTMRKATRTECTDMRLMLVEEVLKGQQVLSVAEGIASYYSKIGVHIKIETIRKWWTRRDNWLATLLKLKDADKKLDELLGRNDALINELWDLERKAKKDGKILSAVTACKEIGALNRNQIELLQSLGRIQQVQLNKTQVDVNVNVTADLLRAYEKSADAAAAKNIAAKRAGEPVSPT